jgi:hypothetical protein|tara:strand:+ start:121 stop:813 length:693 start_codon:yes stop_codon:yes gene_type:complete
MSGSRALASARRRRAGPPEPKPIQSQGNMPSSYSSYTSSPEVSSTPPLTNQKMTPAQMLLSHNKIIENMQQVISNLNDEVLELNNSISLINNKLENINIDEHSKEYYETQINNMNDAINDTKKHVLKVQTFSMETNLQCMEMKKAQHLKYDKLNENIYETSDRVIEILSKLDNTVDNSVDIIPKDTLNVKINDFSGNVVETETQTKSQNQTEEDTYVTMSDGKKIKKIIF